MPRLCAWSLFVVLVCLLAVCCQGQLPYLLVHDDGELTEELELNVINTLITSWNNEFPNTSLVAVPRSKIFNSSANTGLLLPTKSYGIPAKAITEASAGAFIITTMVMYTCLDLDVGMIPLASATLSSLNPVYRTDSASGLILTLATRDDINTLADLEGKVVASAGPLYQEGIQYQMGVMQKAGVSLLEAPLQWRHYNESQRVLLPELLYRRVDVILLESGMLEVATSISNMPASIFKVIDPQISPDGPDLARSTPLYPFQMAASFPHTPPEKQQHMQELLLGLAATGSGQILEYNLPLSSASTRSLLEDLNLLTEGEDGSEGPQCSSTSVRTLLTGRQHPMDSARCPEGSFPRPSWQGEQNWLCTQAGVECVANARCTCRPCIKGSPFISTAISSEQATAGQTNQSIILTALESPCQRVKSCLTIRQFDRASFVLADLSGSQNFASRLSFRVGSLEGALLQFNSSKVPGSAYASADFPKQGLITVSVFYDGEHMPFSPFFVTVDKPLCPNDRVANDAGDCTCSASKVLLGSRCIPNNTVIAVFLVAGLVAMAILAAAFVLCQRHQLDQAWLVDPLELKHDSQPVTEGALQNADATRPTPATYQHQRVSVLTLRSAQPLTTSTLKGSVLHSPIRRQSSKLSALRSFRRDKGMERFAREMRNMIKTRHPCLVTVLGAVVDDGPCQVITEPFDRTLSEVLGEKDMNLDTDIQLAFAKDLIEGLHYLHTAASHVHGNLNSSYIMVDSNLRAKIGYFGFEQVSNLRPSNAYVYKAPELFTKGALKTKETDIYALGILFSEIFTRQPPYPGMSRADVIKGVSEGTSFTPLRPMLPSSNELPEEVLTLTAACWDTISYSRPSCERLRLRFNALHVGGIGASLFKRNEDSKFQRQLVNTWFPVHQADQLIDGETVRPTHHPAVTLFYSEVENYPLLAEHLPVNLLANGLHRLFSRMDELANSFGLCKVETVGDSYLCVANLEEEQPDHAVRMVDFALEVQAAAAALLVVTGDQELGGFKLCIGLHSGPVTSCVLGVSRPRFTLLGSLVQEVADLGEHGHPCKVQCSELSAALIIAQAGALGKPHAEYLSLTGQRVADSKTYWVGSTSHFAKRTSRGAPRQASTESKREGSSRTSSSRRRRRGSRFHDSPSKFHTEMADSPQAMRSNRVSYDEVVLQADANPPGQDPPTSLTLNTNTLRTESVL
eukprot:m.128487 g.128487  ORF g.128487 m.128487 type:complete len:1196 (+) comp15832_c0_seq2:122-3709(+)